MFPAFCYETIIGFKKKFFVINLVFIKYNKISSNILNLYTSIFILNIEKKYIFIAKKLGVNFIFKTLVKY
ncbi:hypothetical protein AB162_023 [Candidatus Palibaumannia cicadellinicola]|uniref:Uncharacterized protein n=1 Tax=Candidatus Palibaumannia cicadellinicola TaxID=186490 RepID=A0A0K2BJQ5_9GAMM|nr:hypothetical protein AB162_023 [Candidatus Baumannia cicadellinicola]